MKLRIKNKISVNSYFEKSIDIYKGLYEQELLNRNKYDDKLSSRITLLTIQLSLVSVLVKWIIQNQNIIIQMGLFLSRANSMFSDCISSSLGEI